MGEGILCDKNVLGLDRLMGICMYYAVPVCKAMYIVDLYDENTDAG